MEFTQKTYLLAYAAIVIPVALSIFFVRRGSKPPVRLRLKKPGEEASRKSPPSRPLPPEPRREISLNAFFNWNGHLWDAYEVLGVPAGSSIESVHLAYVKITANADQDSRLFFKAAFDVISRPS